MPPSFDPLAQSVNNLATSQTTVVLAADDSGVLARSFLLALVVVAPLALWQWWRIRTSRRQHQRSASYQQASDLSGIARVENGGATLEAVVAEINRVGSTLDTAGSATIRVPSHLTVGGSDADPKLVEAVLRDALDRSGLAITDTTSDDEGVQLQCRRR